MTNRVPKRFVGLHNHTGFSPFDGLGYPDEHFRWCMENGLDGHAITEHGNLNSYAHAQLWIEEWAKSNKDKKFKYIPGIEAYYHPDLAQWKRDAAAAEQARNDKKAAAKLAKEQQKLQTKIIAVIDANDETEDIEMSNALTIENEDETKSTKHFNPVNRRHHLVILPKNQKGLLNIFAATSRSFLDGFYKFPRMDWNILREAGKEGNIIVSSACIGGMPAYLVFQELQKIKFEDFNEKLLDDPTLLERCITAIGNCYEQMVSAVGEGNYFLELQFNRLPAQNLVNRALIEFAKRNGKTGQLVVTGDAHYYNPDRWKDRELYKKLGFMNYAAYSPDSLPKSKDDLKCELYPKNAQQMWDEYLKSKEGTSFYDDELVIDAIERAHDIAHHVIGEVPPDRSPKFPTKLLVPAGTNTFNHLVKLCKDGMVKRGLQDKPEYIARLKEELGVIKAMKNEVYFISYQKIMELARSVCLCGPARGSGGGSLVAYVLYITDLDPLYWDLPFARFLSVYRKGAPDIDCVHEDHLVVMADSTLKRAIDIVTGDTVLGGDGEPHVVTATYSRKLRYYESAVWIRVRASDGTLGHILVVPGHKFVKDDGTIVYCRDLKIGDKLMASCGVEITNIEHGGYGSSTGRYVDLTVEGDHRFQLVPFNVVERHDSDHDPYDHVIGYCSQVIPGTFVACGECGNYCSDWCLNKARGDYTSEI